LASVTSVSVPEGPAVRVDVFPNVGTNRTEQLWIAWRNASVVVVGGHANVAVGVVGANGSDVGVRRSSDQQRVLEASFAASSDRAEQSWGVWILSVGDRRVDSWTSARIDHVDAVLDEVANVCGDRVSRRTLRGEGRSERRWANASGWNHSLDDLHHWWQIWIWRRGTRIVGVRSGGNGFAVLTRNGCGVHFGIARQRRGVQVAERRASTRGEGANQRWLLTVEVVSDFNVECSTRTVVDHADAVANDLAAKRQGVKTKQVGRNCCGVVDRAGAIRSDDALDDLQNRNRDWAVGTSLVR